MDDHTLPAFSPWSVGSISSPLRPVSSSSSTAGVFAFVHAWTVSQDMYQQEVLLHI